MQNLHAIDETHPCPVRAKFLYEISDINSGRFSDGIDIVYQPLHTQGVQLLLKYLYTLGSNDIHGTLNYSN